jgi:hypothetical protein
MGLWQWAHHIKIHGGRWWKYDAVPIPFHSRNLSGAQRWPVTSETLTRLENAWCSSSKRRRIEAETQQKRPFAAWVEGLEPWPMAHERLN